MTRSHSFSHKQLALVRFLLSGGLLLAVALTTGRAQVTTVLTPDASLPRVTTVRPPMPPHDRIYTITGGTRPDNGPNLFHSFEQFQVGTGDTVRFRSPAGVENILSRVTGGQASVIDGVLQSRRPGVNVYLLNPNGIVFQSHASLQVGGAFHVSTADVLRLSDGGTFHTRLSETSRLTVAEPVAFGFLGPSPAPITVQDSLLTVAPGRAMSMVGGPIQIVGGELIAPGGQIQLTSVASPGEVGRTATGPFGVPEVGAGARLGPITLQGGALDASGDRHGTVVVQGGQVWVEAPGIFAEATGRGAAGRIVIQADTLTVTKEGQISAIASAGSSGRAGQVVIQADALMVAGNSLISASAQLESSGVAGRVTIQAGTLTVTGQSEIAASGAIRSGTVHIHGQRPGSRVHRMLVAGGAQIAADLGTAGRIVVQADRLTVRDNNSQLRTSTNLEEGGNAGLMRITAGTLTLTGGDTAGLMSITKGRSPGGNIVIRAGQMRVLDDTQVRADSENPTARAGTIRIRADALLVDDGRIGSSTSGSGNAGNVAIRAGKLVVTNGGLIAAAQARNPEGTGQGGIVRITATDIVVGGLNRLNELSRIVSITNGKGAAGMVDLAVHRRLVLAAGSQISTNTSQSATGDAGTVRITADTMTIAGGKIQSETSGAGDSGSIDLSVNQLLMTAGGLISTTSTATATGQAGGILVHGLRGRTTAADSVTLRNGTLRTRADGDGQGGSILVRAIQVTLDRGAVMSAEAAHTRGGNITVMAPSIVRLHDSAITAKVQEGREGQETVGGNITINSAAVILANSQVTADAPQGQGGNIRIAGGVLLADPSSRISASGETEGHIDLPPINNLSGLVAPLTPEFAQVAALLQTPCAARLREGSVSSFVVRGRASLPTTYDGWLPSRLYEPLPLMPPGDGGRPPRQSLVVPTAPLPGLPEAASPPTARLLRQPCEDP